MELEPLHHTLRTGLAEILFNARRYAEARAECDRVLEWEPGFSRALTVRD